MEETKHNEPVWKCLLSCLKIRQIREAKNIREEMKCKEIISPVFGS